MLGEDNFSSIDIRVRVSGGGHTSQIYAIRQAIGKAAVAYWMKYWDASHALSLKKSLVDYDRTLVIADPRRMEPKKFGGGGARARRQKRCVCVLRPSPGSRAHSSFISVTDKRVHLSLLARLFPTGREGLPGPNIRGIHHKTVILLAWSKLSTLTTPG